MKLSQLIEDLLKAQENIKRKLDQDPEVVIKIQTNDSYDTVLSSHPQEITFNGYTGKLEIE